MFSYKRFNRIGSLINSWWNNSLNYIRTDLTEGIGNRFNEDFVKTMVSGNEENNL